uniref:DUF7378 domain-containing protein n=1 Tax=Oryza brachyantha TaxID=4533 RepID=J3L3N6_ORYBR
MLALPAMVFAAPSFFIAVPWRLPMLISWGVYVSLGFAVSTYVNLFLPLTPAAVDEDIRNVGLGWIGATLGLINGILLTLGSNLLMMAFTCVVSVLIVGMLVLWAFLVGRYGRPERVPLSTSTSTSTSKPAEEITWRDIHCVYAERESVPLSTTLGYQSAEEITWCDIPCAYTEGQVVRYRLQIT